MTFKLCIFLLSFLHLFLDVRGIENGKSLVTGFHLRSPEIKVFKYVETGRSRYFGLEKTSLITNSVNVTRINRQIITGFSVIKVVLICKANYHIYWNYDIPMEISHHDYDISIHSVRISRNFSDPSTYEFHSYLTLSGDGRGITGNYSCISSRDERIRDYYYIFWTRAERHLIYGHQLHKEKVRTGKPQPCSFYSCPGKASKRVKADKDNAILILPCTVVSPEIKLQLFKKFENLTEHTILKDMAAALPDSVKYNEDHLNFQEINIIQNRSITFEPDRGFVLKIQELPFPYGTYKCLLSYTNVLKSDEVLVINAVKGIVNDGENKVLVGTSKQYFEDGRIICCSNGTQPPYIFKVECLARFHCHRIRKQLKHFEHFDRNGIALKNCQSSSSFNQGTLGVFRCYGSGIDVTKEFYISVEDNEASISNIYYDEGITTMAMAGNHTITITNSHDISENEIYSNLEVIFTCYPPLPLFDFGVRWSILWKNLSIQILPEMQITTEQLLNSFDLNSIHLNLTDNQIAGIMCYAPLYNSTEWVNKSVPLKTKRCEKPTIDGVWLDRIIWRENDENKKIINTFYGIPAPQVECDTHESAVKELGPLDIFSYTTNSTTITIYFAKALHSLEEKIICTAENFGGSVEKTIFLKILPLNATLEFNGDFETSHYSSEDKVKKNNKTAAVALAGKMVFDHGSDIETRENYSSIVYWILGISILILICFIGIGILFLRYPRFKRLRPGDASQSFRESTMAFTVFQSEEY